MDIPRASSKVKSELDGVRLFLPITVSLAFRPVGRNPNRYFVIHAQVSMSLEPFPVHVLKFPPDVSFVHLYNIVQWFRLQIVHI